MTCGADGVWSVWTLRNNEIIYKDDAHADKIWGLAVSGDGNCIVTGSSDATVRIWDDVTVDVIAQQVQFQISHCFVNRQLCIRFSVEFWCTSHPCVQSREEDQRVEFEQHLSNAVHRKDWAAAFQIAFNLNKPRAMLNVVNQLLVSAAVDEDFPGGLRAQETLRVIVSRLNDEQLIKLVTFVCDWNTTSGKLSRHDKHYRKFIHSAANCTAAQEVLLAIFACKAAADLVQLKGIKRMAESLVLYSHRHYDRLSRLLQVRCALHVQHRMGQFSD